MYIEKISTRHLEQYKKLRLDALRERPEAFSASYEEEVLMPDSKFEERLTHPDNITLGAFIGETLVGMVTLITSNRQKTKHNGHIVSMIVSPKYRKHGIGQELLYDIFMEAKNHGIENLFLSVTSLNIAAIHLYHKIGFRYYASEKKAIKINDKYYHNDLFVLYLS